MADRTRQIGNKSMTQTSYPEFTVYFDGGSGMQPEIALIASLTPHLSTDLYTNVDVHIYCTNVAAGHVIPEV